MGFLVDETPNSPTCGNWVYFTDAKPHDGNILCQPRFFLFPSFWWRNIQHSWFRRGEVVLCLSCQPGEGPGFFFLGEILGWNWGLSILFHGIKGLQQQGMMSVTLCACWAPPSAFRNVRWCFPGGAALGESWAQQTASRPGLQLWRKRKLRVCCLLVNI